MSPPNPYFSAYATPPPYPFTVIDAESQALHPLPQDWTQAEEEAARKHGRAAVRIYRNYTTLRHPSFWNPLGASGCQRFLDTAWALLSLSKEPEAVPKMLHHRLHVKLAEYFTAKAASQHRETIQAWMQITHILATQPRLYPCYLPWIAQLGHAYAPCFAEAFFQKMPLPEAEQRLSLCVLPCVDESALISPEVSVNILINGQRKERIMVDPQATEEELLHAALTPHIQLLLGCMGYTKVVMVPGKVVNILQ